MWVCGCGCFCRSDQFLEYCYITLKKNYIAIPLDVWTSIQVIRWSDALGREANFCVSAQSCNRVCALEWNGPGGVFDPAFMVSPLAWTTSTSRPPFLSSNPISTSPVMYENTHSLTLHSPSTALCIPTDLPGWDHLEDEPWWTSD